MSWHSLSHSNSRSRILLKTRPPSYPPNICPSTAWFNSSILVKRRWSSPGSGRKEPSGPFIIPMVPPVYLCWVERRWKFDAKKKIYGEGNLRRLVPVSIGQLGTIPSDPRLRRGSSYNSFVLVGFCRAISKKRLVNFGNLFFCPYFFR